MSIDHVRAGKRSKARGERGELEVRDLLRGAGFLTARRNFMSGGQGGGDLTDAIPDHHLEVKYTERLMLPAAWRQSRASARATDTIVIIHRANMQPWLATLTIEDWFELKAPSMQWLAIGPSAPLRAEFLAWQRSNPVHPGVIHQLAPVREAVVTVLATDWLDVLSAGRDAAQWERESS